MRNLILFLLLGSLLGCINPLDNPAAEGFNEAASDPEAVVFADLVMMSMGGRANWDATHYLAWDIFGQRHIWDKWTGEFRHERDSLVVLMNIHTDEGRIWVDGEEVTDAETKAQHLRRSKGAWINNSYWLIMPFKLKDSGVTLKYLGERNMEDGRGAHVLGLTFEDVGFTPQNRYEIFVDNETMQVEQWSFFRNADDEEPSYTLPWTNYQTYGNIEIATGRGRFDVPFVGVYDAVPEGTFTDPAPVVLEGRPDE